MKRKKLSRLPGNTRQVDRLFAKISVDVSAACSTAEGERLKIRTTDFLSPISRSRLISFCGGGQNMRYPSRIAHGATWDPSMHRRFLCWRRDFYVPSPSARPEIAQYPRRLDQRPLMKRTTIARTVPPCCCVQCIQVQEVPSCTATGHVGSEE